MRFAASDFGPTSLQLAIPQSQILRSQTSKFLYVHDDNLGPNVRVRIDDRYKVHSERLNEPGNGSRGGSFITSRGTSLT